MSDIVNDSAEGQNPTTVTHFQQLAAQLEAAMKAVLAEVPKFEMPQRAKTSAVRVHLTVPPDFIVNAAAVVKSSEIDLIKVFDPAEAQNVLQFVEAFKPLVEVAAAFAAGLDFTVKVQYARAAAGALAVFAIVKRLAKKGDGTMERHVETRSRTLGRKRPRPRVTAPAPPDTQPNPQV